MQQVGVIQLDIKLIIAYNLAKKIGSRIAAGCLYSHRLNSHVHDVNQPSVRVLEQSFHGGQTGSVDGATLDAGIQGTLVKRDWFQAVRCHALDGIDFGFLNKNPVK